MRVNSNETITKTKEFVPERWKADEWDGHTPVEAANRLYRFSLYYDKWQY